LIFTSISDKNKAQLRARFVSIFTAHRYASAEYACTLADVSGSAVRLLDLSTHVPGRNHSSSCLTCLSNTLTVWERNRLQSVI